MGSSTRTPTRPTRSEREVLQVLRAAHAEMDRRYYLPANRGECRCDGRTCRIRADDPRHGTISCYRNQGCRCEPCRIAQRLEYTNAKGAA